MDKKNLDKLALTVRTLSIDGVQKANSGHPGMPLGAADYASALWAHHLRFNPSDPKWDNRDRFVLSAGHGSMLIYSLLHLFGYDLKLDELKNFRQWDSRTPGHPEFGLTPGVETTTGPLGQGFANGVGLALSGKLLAERYSKELFNYRVYGIVSDGDLMEGVASEAASLAGHLALNNLIYFYDDNEISIGGDTDVCFTESVPKRFEGYGWFVQEIDGHDAAAALQALERAKQEKNRPSLIVAKTVIGFGSPHKAGTAEVHGSPLGKDELRLTKEKLGWPVDAEFLVPDDVKIYVAGLVTEKRAEYDAWQKNFKAWAAAHPALAEEFKNQRERKLPAQLKEDLIAAALKEQKADATRNLSGKSLNVIAKHVSYLVGGSADLEPSTKTLIKDSPDIGPGAYKGRNIRFGVREHAMGSLVNGLAYCESWFPYSATFLVFADYMRPAIRLAALSHLQSLFIFTHDSFWVGEDGPTHEPIEHILSLRAIPNLYVFRPADALETALSYQAALELKKSPSTLLFTRQNLPVLNQNRDNVDGILKGGYVLSGKEHSDVALIATGSEVWVAFEAAKLLKADGVNARVVSLPCRELFMKQDKSYRDGVIPPGARKVSIEAGLTMGWERVVGDKGLSIGIDHYGASAPGEVLAEKFGFTPAAVREKVLSWYR